MPRVVWPPARLHRESGRPGGATRAHLFFSPAKPVGFEEIEYFDSPKLVVLLVDGEDTAGTQGRVSAVPAARGDLFVADKVDRQAYRS